MDATTTGRPGGRRIVVTGAASGIGAALATRLVAAGHDVIGVDRSVESLPAGVQPLHCDLTDAQAVDRAVGEIASSTSRLDGLAAVAGVPGTAPSRTVYAVNIVGLRRLVRALEPSFAPGGAVVLLSSMAGYRGQASEEEIPTLLALPDEALLQRLLEFHLDGPEAYQLSKQLVHHYTLQVAARLHPRGVRCLSISPGPVTTPILADFRATMPTLDLAGELVGRHARPEEIAAIAEFALSPAASWLNGVDLRADGGLSALRIHEAVSSAVR